MKIIEKLKALYEEHQTVFRVFGIVILVLLVGIAIFLAFRFTIPSNKLDNEGLVIAFIGVLATFIVIGNFAQTSRIEEGLNKKINELDKRVAICESNDKQFPGLAEDVKTNKEKIGTIEHNLQETKMPLEKRDLGRVLKLFVGKEGDVRKCMHLYAKLLNPNARYLVEYNDGTKEQISISYSTAQKILNFYDKDQCFVDSEDIAYISGVPFDEEELIYAYQLLNEIDTQEYEMIETEKLKEDASEFSGSGNDHVNKKK